MYFLLTFLLTISAKKIHPKCAPDRSISISKMQKLLRLRGGTPPSQTLPPLGRFAPSLAFSYNIENVAPPRNKFLRTALPGGGGVLRPHFGRYVPRQSETKFRSLFPSCCFLSIIYKNVTFIQSLYLSFLFFIHRLKFTVRSRFRPFFPSF